MDFKRFLKPDAWLPLVVLLLVGFSALALVVHRQWSEYERLVYPAMEPILEIADQAGDGARWLPHFMKG